MRTDVRTVLLPAAARFSPFDLGEALHDLWDAERTADLTLSGGAVAAWTSARHGHAAAQATSGARPVYSSTSFNGRPGVTFDGIDDELTYAGVGSFPTGSAPCEIWALVDQTAPASDPGGRAIFAYGAAATASRRTVQRAVSGGTNVAQVEVGNGGGANTATASGDFSGRQVLRAISGGGQARVERNGVTGAAASSTPSIGTTRTRMGASNGNMIGNFFKGVIAFIAVTDPLSDAQAARMLAWLRARGGIG